jgi:hypothetical protein
VWASLEVDQFNFKNQWSVAGNRGREAFFSIREVWCDAHFAQLALRHFINAFFPAADDLPRPQNEFKRLIAFSWAVKSCAILKFASVVDDDGVTSFGKIAAITKDHSLNLNAHFLLIY